MSEVVSRLWGWDTAKREIPDLKAIFHLKSHSRRNPSLEKALFTAYGIDERDITWVNEPVWLESVVNATPMWQNEVPHYVHPDLMQTWDRLAEGLLAGAPETQTYERIFVSRGPDTRHRRCRNNEAVEGFFASNGFRVIYPEKLSMAQQVAIFRDAEVIAGYGGSAMFNMMYSRNARTVILLNQEAYFARNEHLYTSLTGGQVHYFWSTPDTPTFQSDWEFDFDRNGEALREVVAGLG
jgi:capsular polysaccharide biosynthesis protein